MKTNRQIIGAKTKEARNRLALNQSDLSKITGVNRTTISAIENGRFRGSLDILERVLDAVGLQLTAAPKVNTLPDWDEIEGMFDEED